MRRPRRERAASAVALLTFNVSVPQRGRDRSGTERKSSSLLSFRPTRDFRQLASSTVGPFDSVEPFDEKKITRFRRDTRGALASRTKLSATATVFTFGNIVPALKKVNKFYQLGSFRGPSLKSLLGTREAPLSATTSRKIIITKETSRASWKIQ